MIKTNNEGFTPETSERPCWRFGSDVKRFSVVSGYLVGFKYEC